MNDRSRLPLVRLLIVGVLVPAVFSAVDHWLLTALQHQNYSTSRAAFTMGAFVVQVGLLGWLCGRFLENPWWRWGLYLWGWILIDTQLLAASTFENRDQLTSALFLTQAGLATIWAIMGTTHWAIRWPACAVLGTLAAALATEGYGLRSDLVPVQLVALAGLCLMLRWQRFRLARIAGPQAASASTEAPKARLMQFSIRHVLIWTTSLAVVLGILRGLDLLSLQAMSPYFQSGDFIPTATAGLLVACVLVVALWAALGEGPLWLRLPVLAIATMISGLSLAVSEWYSYNVSRRGFNATSPPLATIFYDLLTTDYLRQGFWHNHSALIVWVTLAGSLLFASLLILRVIGYRLVRRVSQSQTTRPLAATIESPSSATTH